MPAARGLGHELSQVESQVRRPGGLGCDAAQGLADENRQLKKLLAEVMLDSAALKDILGKNG